MCGTQSTPGGGAPSQTQPILANIASQGNQIKRALSKSRQAQAAGSSKAAKVFDAAHASGGQSQQQQQSTAVLLDIDKLVKTSAAAAFLGNAPSGKAVQKPRAPHQVAMSRNTGQIAESHSGKTSQAVAAHPLVGKKTVAAAAGTGTATQASQGSATVVNTNMTPTDSAASNQLQKMLRQQATSQNQQRH